MGSQFGRDMWKNSYLVKKAGIFYKNFPPREFQKTSGNEVIK